MNVRLDRLHFPVTTLGPGRRLGLWFQGCSLACPGCLSRDTWDPDARDEVALDDVVAAADALCEDVPDGVTISGGEPFEQPDALSALVPRLREWGRDRGGELDVLVYSGYPLEHLRREHPGVLERIDALIPEPYDASAPTTAPFRGSANQPLVLLTDLARARFRDAGDHARPNLQFAVTDGRVWMVGVPRHGDLGRLERKLRAKGVDLQGVSWRP